MNVIDILQSLESFAIRCNGCLQHIDVYSINRQSEKHFEGLATCGCTADKGPVLVNLTDEMIQSGKIKTSLALNIVMQRERGYTEAIIREKTKNIDFSGKEFDGLLDVVSSRKSVEQMNTHEYAQYMKRKRG